MKNINNIVKRGNKMPFADRNKQLEYSKNYRKTHPDLRHRNQKVYLREYRQRLEVKERMKKYKEQKICPKCKTLSDGETFYCSKCRKEKNLISTLYRERHRKDYNEKQRGYLRKYRRRDKLIVLIHYSGNPPKCQCCGENHIEFLTIDHINNDGAKDRKKGLMGHVFYKWLIKNGFPEGYRILCYNCNCSLGHLGYCPHKST